MAELTRPAGNVGSGTGEHCGFFPDRVLPDRGNLFDDYEP
jgi:hypothetical protein